MPLGTFNNGIPAPDTQGRDAAEHVCGNCRNPYTRAGRSDCPNARKGER